MSLKKITFEQKKSILDKLPNKSKEKEKKKWGRQRMPNKSKVKRKKKRCEEKQYGWRYNCTWAFSSKYNDQFLPSVFSPFWRENFLMGSGRKHMSFTINFPSFPFNQILQKSFALIFSPKFSIQHISPPNKHTLNV